MRDLRDTLAAAGVHTLLVQFTDLDGHAKGKWVPLHQLETVVHGGAGFAGPSIVATGLPRQGPRSEYYARGDLSTLQALPWMPGFARIVGDGFVDGQPFQACPRQVLRRAVGLLEARGWSLQAGLEPEFFLLRREPASGRLAPADDRDRLDKPSYDLRSMGRQHEFLQALRQALEGCGLTVLQIDHEDAWGQYELNTLHSEVLAAADRLMLFKLAAHELAQARGLVFSTMPKPLADQPGSGLHVHASLHAGAQPLFVPEAGAVEASRAEMPLSALGRHFVAGVLAHSPGLCALAAPTVNSYRRLAVGPSRSGTSWAPALCAHGPNNRTALVRTLPGRFEWRLPDAAANPYLMLAGLVVAGLDGIDRQLEPPPAVTTDLFEASGAALQSCPHLPRQLDAALDALDADEVLRDGLGHLAVDRFLALKHEEWRDYQCHVSDWELDRYGDAG